MLTQINRHTLKSIPWDVECKKTLLTSSAMTGRNMIIVAVLLANSVKQARKAVISITAAAGGTSANGWRWPPIQEARPDSCQTPKDSA